MIAFLSDICGFSSVIVFGFDCCTVKFKIISFVVMIRIIRNAIVVGSVFDTEVTLL